VKVLSTELPGVLLIEPQVFRDSRGFLFEAYHAKRYADAGVRGPFVQLNHSMSVARTIRGLHYQRRRPQAKLVRVLRGEAFDVAVDIRRGSPTFARWVGCSLSADNLLQMYIPPGFAHGFCALVEGTEVVYMCTDFYAPEDGYGVKWDDPSIGIDWPVADPILSARDTAFLPLSPDREDLPLFEAAQVTR
jgi:dTDP-4-dehydrorhamnose 3,5-epimerase